MDPKNFNPGMPKNVEDTKMLNTEAHETVNYSEKNKVGEEYIVKHPNFGTLGAISPR